MATILEASVRLGEFVKMDIPRPPSIIEKRVLERGGLGVVYALPGVGKTMLSYQLAYAVANGLPWFGLPTNPTKVGVMALELSDDASQDRYVNMMASMNGDGVPNPDVYVVRKDQLETGGYQDLMTDRVYDQLKEWVVALDLGLIILDPLNRLHSVDEKDPRSMGMLMQRLHRLRHETNCAVMLNHHEVKVSAPGPSSLQSMRGSRIADDVQLAYRMRRASQGKNVILECMKCTNAPEMDPVWLERDPSGWLRQIDTPVVALSYQTRAKEQSSLVTDAILGIVRNGTTTGSQSYVEAGYIRALLSDQGFEVGDMAFRRRMHAMLRDRMLVVTAVAKLPLKERRRYPDKRRLLYKLGARAGWDLIPDVEPATLETDPSLIEDDPIDP